jgi:prepilin-type N-terminal cleavage/methylation domain-containing protein
MDRASLRRPAGFSLIEVIVATAVLTVGVLGLAQLIVVSTVANRDARATTTATVLARSKMEELRAAPFDGLAASPPGVLAADTPGFVDYIDGSGAAVPSSAATFVRRWAITPLASDPLNAVILQVLVRTTGKIGGETRLMSVRTRWGR